MKKGANRKTSRVSRKTRTNKTKSIKRGGGYQDEKNRLEAVAEEDKSRAFPNKVQINKIDAKLKLDLENLEKERVRQTNDAMNPLIKANDDQAIAYLNEVLRSGDIIRLRRFAEVCSYFQQYKYDDPEYKRAFMPRSETPAPASYFNRASSALGSLFTGRQAETPKVNNIPRTNLFDDDAYLADMERK